jgi:hypothetical protein
MEARKLARLLRSGDRFRMHPDCGDPGEYVVLRVTPCSAIVRPLASRHVEVVKGGEVVATFEAPGKPFGISPTASVILLKEGGW